MSACIVDLHTMQVSGGKEESIDQARIIALRPLVDPELKSEMQIFLKRVATDCDLMNFYRTFVKCCQHVLERRNTFSRIMVMNIFAIRVSQCSPPGKINSILKGCGLGEVITTKLSPTPHPCSRLYKCIKDKSLLTTIPLYSLILGTT